MLSIRTKISILLFYLIVFSITVHAQVISVEAPSPDVTLTVRGPEKTIGYINPQKLTSLDNCIVLLSSEYGKKTGLNSKNQIAVQVNNKMKVTKVINAAGPGKARPSFSESVDIDIPEGGFVLIAIDNSYQTQGYKKFLAENFREGDLVKLRINNEIRSLREVVAQGGKEAPLHMNLDSEKLFTSLKNKEMIKGVLSNRKKEHTYYILLKQGENILETKKPDKQGKFELSAALKEGVNYFEVTVRENGTDVDKQNLTIFKKKENKEKPEVVMWVEQFPNAKTLTSEEAVEEMMKKCSQAGVTAMALDVKGPEGYVSYKKNDLSHSPYYTATVNPNKKVPETSMDLLETFILMAHKYGMKVYASLNCFTEGNVTTSDYAILKQHPEWEEIVQRPEDKGKLLKISESTAGKEAREGKRVVLGFVNPVNPEVQDFQLLRYEEVLKNYDVDGVVMDRCRYDNLYADFSDVSKNKFAEYLQKEGKQLTAFPDDAFLIDDNGKMIEGKYFREWITFRSSVIKGFTDRVRNLVNQYKKSKNPDLALAAYVGSWFEVYWQNGVNWSSENFKYNDHLGFPESRFYTPRYAQTSYTGNIDFLMIGTYYKTGREVNKYITLGNILTGGELPLYGSMSLPDLRPEEQADVFATSLTNSSGLMLFDYCYVDWSHFSDNMQQAIKKSNKNKTNNLPKK